MTIAEIEIQLKFLQSEFNKLRLKGEKKDEARVTVWHGDVKVCEYTLFHGKGTPLSNIIGPLTRISDPVIRKDTTITIEFQE